MKINPSPENNLRENNILACYLRISDEDFDLKQNILKDESASISAQRRLIHNYIESHADLRRMDIREFLDDGYSGTNYDRPAVQELFRLASEGSVGCIIVKDMSRFGRNYIETGAFLEQVFPSMGIRFIAVNDSFDSSEYPGNTPGLEMAFKNVIYDYYSKDLSAKVKSIRKIQQKRGDFLAAKPPYGYIISPADHYDGRYGQHNSPRYDQHDGRQYDRHDSPHYNRHKLEIDPESAEVVKTIFRLALSGYKPAEIARELNGRRIPTPAQRLHKLYGFRCGGLTERELMSQFWKPAQITKILQDETMTGATVNNRVQVKAVGSRKYRRQKPEDYVIVRDTHEGIIARDTFLQAAAIIRSRKTVRTGNRQKNENLFYRKIYCGHCGCGLKHEVHTRRSGIRAVFYCPHARPSGGGTCGLNSIKDEFLKELALGPLQVLVQLIWDRQTPLPEPDKERLQSRLRAISRLSAQNKGKFPRLYEEYSTGRISREQFVRQKDAISRADSALDAERDETEKKLYAMESAVLTAEHEKTEFGRFLESTKLDTLTQNAVDLFIDKIVVHSKGPADSKGSDSKSSDSKGSDSKESLDLFGSIEITWNAKDLFVCVRHNTPQ